MKELIKSFSSISETGSWGSGTRRECWIAWRHLIAQTRKSLTADQGGQTSSPQTKSVISDQSAVVGRTGDSLIKADVALSCVISPKTATLYPYDSFSKHICIAINKIPVGNSQTGFTIIYPVLLVCLDSLQHQQGISFQIVSL